MKLITEQEIHQLIKKHNLQIAVISYGGCASNTLTQFLTNNCNLNASKPIWNNICHHPTIINSDIPFIYIYRNPIEALMSQKRRGKGYWDVNQCKLANDGDLVDLSDENLLQLMLIQFSNWAFSDKSNIHVMNYDELFTEEGYDRLLIFLKKHFPTKQFPPKSTIKYKPTNKYKLPQNIIELEQKYKTDIDIILNYNPLVQIPLLPRLRLQNKLVNLQE